MFCLCLLPRLWVILLTERQTEWPNDRTTDHITVRSLAENKHIIFSEHDECGWQRQLSSFLSTVDFRFWRPDIVSIMSNLMGCNIWNKRPLCEFWSTFGSHAAARILNDMLWTHRSQNIRAYDPCFTRSSLAAGWTADHVYDSSYGLQVSARQCSTVPWDVLRADINSHQLAYSIRSLQPLDCSMH